jgi:NAD(P)-dependent dehydrogenase (short-subunit alcohol dehydrogenase family)
VALTQRVLPALRTARGRLVNVSSVNGRVASPYSAPYAASKFALEALSDSWRIELRRWGIRTVLIEPGAIATPIWQTSARRALRLSGDYPAKAHDLYGRVFTALGNVRTPGRAVPPERVARAIARALHARRPRARYVVGRDARLAVLLKALLPTTWFDALLAQRRKP